MELSNVDSHHFIRTGKQEPGYHLPPGRCSPAVAAVAAQTPLQPRSLPGAWGLESPCLPRFSEDAPISLCLQVAQCCLLPLPRGSPCPVPARSQACMVPPAPDPSFQPCHPGFPPVSSTNNVLGVGSPALEPGPTMCFEGHPCSTFLIYETEGWTSHS